MFGLKKNKPSPSSNFILDIKAQVVATNSISSGYLCEVEAEGSNSERYIEGMHARVCVCVREYMYVCVCMCACNVCVFASMYVHLNQHFTYIYICIYWTQKTMLLQK